MKLRNLKIDDVPRIVTHLNNPNVTRFLTTRIPQPYRTSDGEAWVFSESNSGLTKAIEVDREFVGVIGISIGEYENSRSAEIGYWIAEEFWGLGITSKALSQMTREVFSGGKIVRIFAPVFSPNKASMRVLEKSGFELEGIFRKSVYKNGKFFDEHIFAIVHS